MDTYALDLVKGRAVVCRSLVGLTGPDPESRTTWIHVAMPGTWEGHPDGAFTLDEASFRSCIGDFEASQAPQSVYHEHPPLSPPGEPTPAAGYVQALRLRDDGLWACVEF